MRRLLTRLHRDDTGVVGGVEALPFGVLVFVVGTLIVVNAWGVVDAKMTVASAAREAVRAYVESPAGSNAEAQARSAAQRTMAAMGRTARPPAIALSGDFERCTRVAATVSYRIPALRLPWVGGLGSFTARSTATELVDPLRSGLAGEATCVR